MNRTLILAVFDRWLASPPRIALVAVLGTAPVLSSFLGSGGGRVGTGSTALLVLVLGAGIIGRDVSTGVLQVLFTRPISRTEYVISRWMGLGIAGAVLAAAQVLLAGIGRFIPAERPRPPGRSSFRSTCSPPSGWPRSSFSARRF